MPTGEFHSLSIDSIVVQREGRQRRELTSIDELAASIRDNGLINPILVQRETLELITGERRLAACRQLGWSHIPAQYEDEVDPVVLKLLEYEENVRRVDFEWQDRTTAVLNYHELKRSITPTWTATDTANAMNMSLRTTLEYIGVAEGLRSGNQKIIEAPKFTTARGIVSRANERAAANELSAVNEIIKPTIDAPPPESILIEDFNTWSVGYEGPRFNFLHCDFPYGIGANKFNQGSASLHGGYEDSAETYWNLLDSLALALPRLATESCHILFWFSMRYYHETLEFFAARTPFKIDPFPLVWLKSDNSGILPDPERGPRRIYETALFGSSGDRKIVSAKSNAHASPSVKDIHMSVKSPHMLQYFFGMFVDGNTRMLDPTCGSAGALRAAEAAGAQYVLGLEQNAEFAMDARKQLEKARALRRAAT